MPCYQINLINVKFKIKNKQILLDVLREEKVEYRKQFGKEIYGIAKRGFISGQINLESQTADIDNQNSLNIIKKKYAEKIIQQVAAKKKWLFRKISENKIQLKKC